MTTMKKMCAAALAVLLLVTGCAGNTKSWVYRSGDVEPPAGVYIHYLISGMSGAVSKLSEAGVDVSAMKTKDILTQTIEDQPASQWITQDAENELRENIAVEQQFAAEGLTLQEGSDASVASSVAAEWDSYGTVYEENGIAQTSMTEVMTNALKRSALFAHYYGEGGKTPVPDTELKDILARDYVKVSALPIQKAITDVTGEDGVVTETVDEQNAALKTEAEGYLTRLQAGESLEELTFEYAKSKAGDAADQVTKPEPGDLAVILSADMAGVNYSTEMVNGAMAIPAEETALVEDSSFYYVMQRTDILADPQDFEAERAVILSDLKSEEFNDMVAAWAAALDLEVNEAALNEYTPERLKID